MLTGVGQVEEAVGYSYNALDTRLQPSDPGALLDLRALLIQRDFLGVDRFKATLDEHAGAGTYDQIRELLDQVEDDPD